MDLPLPADPVDLFAAAQAYTGNSGDAWHAVGAAQVAILRALGCRPEHHVLEVGAGSLCGGHAIIAYLDADQYVGIEPNGWLVRAALEGAGIEPLVAEKRPVFLARDDFDASFLGRRFDFAIGHSILSHAAHWQLPRLLTALRPVLHAGSVVAMSLRLRDADSFDREWQYPGNSWFSSWSVRAFAEACGFLVETRDDLRAIMVAAAPNNVHDWVVFRPMPARLP